MMSSSGGSTVPHPFNLSEALSAYDNDNWNLVIAVLAISWLVFLTLPVIFIIEEVRHTIRKRRRRVAPNGNSNEENMPEISDDIEDDDDSEIDWTERRKSSTAPETSTAVENSTTKE